MRRRSIAGRTLIETLVVGVIIAVLSAVGTIVGIRAVSSAKDSGCVANLGTISKALRLYCSDHDDYFPPFGSLAADNPDPVLGQAINDPRDDLLKQVLRGYGAVDQTFFCPLDKHSGTSFRGVFGSFKNSSYTFVLTKHFFPEKDFRAVPFSSSQIDNPSGYAQAYDTTWMEPLDEYREQLQALTAHEKFQNTVFGDGHVHREAVPQPGIRSLG